MQIDFYGLRFEASRITCYLWSPWRASALEHRLFNEVKQLPGLHLESQPEEMRLQIPDVKTWSQAMKNMSRLLKGWQEESASTGKNACGPNPRAVPCLGFSDTAARKSATAFRKAESSGALGQSNAIGEIAA